MCGNFFLIVYEHSHSEFRVWKCLLGYYSLVITVLGGLCVNGSQRHKFGMFLFLIKRVKAGNSLSSDLKERRILVDAEPVVN